MKLAKPIATALGAVALTLVAAGSALAVNIGILSQSDTSAVAALDAVTNATTVATSQPSPQFVYVDLTDLAPSTTVTTQPAEPQVTSAPAVNLVGDGEQQYEGAEYDD
jgi:hypothetical protein